MAQGIGFGNTEILQVVKAVAAERGIPEREVFAAVEESIRAASKRTYGQEHNIKVEIDQRTGEIRINRVVEVVEEPENNFTEISLADAKTQDPELEIGDKIYEPLPQFATGRIAAQAAKQVIINKVRDAERDKQYNEFIGRVGEITTGVVKRVDYGNLVVDINRTEAYLPKESLIRTELYRVNDRITAYIENVKRENKGPQIFLSRTNNQFLAKLFMREVPEIYDGIIEIKAVVREAGSKAKIAVQARDRGIDAVGSCVGIRGSRVQAVMNELHGEKIDIISYSPDPATFVMNALSPVEVGKVVIDEEKRRMEVVVAEDQLSIAIGRRGQNVRLASQLTGWGIDILTDTEEAKIRMEEFALHTQIFMFALDIDEVMAQLLAAEGFSTIQDIAFIELKEIAAIEGFDENLAEALQSRAQTYVELQEKLSTTWKELGIDDNVVNIKGMNSQILNLIGKCGIKSIDELAETEKEEFVEIVKDLNIPEKMINYILDTAKQLDAKK
jgi:transcription termination/antitermination protein NusA